MATTPAVYPRHFDIAEMCEEAAERAGIEFRSGYALTSARRSLELLAIDWANRGLNLWCIDVIDLPFDLSGEVIELPPDTVDVLDAVLYTGSGATINSLNSSGIQLDRVSLGNAPSVTAVQPSILHSGTRPYSFWVHRTVEPPILHLWPALGTDHWLNSVVRCWRLRYMRGLKPGGTDTPELPYRLQPAMIAGLAYYLALKAKDAAAQQRVPMLKAFYEEQFDLAAQEDRDRSNFHFVPDIPYL